MSRTLTFCVILCLGYSYFVSFCVSDTNILCHSVSRTLTFCVILCLGHSHFVSFCASGTDILCHSAPRALTFCVILCLGHSHFVSFCYSDTHIGCHSVSQIPTFFVIYVPQTLEFFVIYVSQILAFCFSSVRQILAFCVISVSQTLEFGVILCLGHSNVVVVCLGYCSSRFPTIPQPLSNYCFFTPFPSHYACTCMCTCSCATCRCISHMHSFWVGTPLTSIIYLHYIQYYWCLTSQNAVLTIFPTWWSFRRHPLKHLGRFSQWQVCFGPTDSMLSFRFVGNGIDPLKV